MKSGYTHITYVLDRSGSKGSVADDVVGGMTEFVESQKKVEGFCTFSLVLFDDQYEKPIDFLDIRRVNLPPFIPRGMTALMDAAGQAIVETGDRLSQMHESERPEKVIVVVHTDGMENSSREYTRERVRQLIEQQEKKYAWEFVFLGTDFDVYAEAGSLGFSSSNTMSYENTTKGISRAYTCLDASISAYRVGSSELNLNE
jgi:uncharacterized protein YegL